MGGEGTVTNACRRRRLRRRPRLRRHLLPRSSFYLSLFLVVGRYFASTALQLLQDGVCFCAIRATLFDCSKATHTSANISTRVPRTQGKLGRA